DVRDSVPLRLMLDHGLRKAAVRTIRFRDFDKKRRQVVFTTRGGRVQTLQILDEAFWADLDRLRQKVDARDDHYLLPRQIARKHRPKRAKELDKLLSDIEDALPRAVDFAAELASDEAALSVTSLAEALQFFRLAHERAWIQTRYSPEQVAGE